jgi:hypothetical protein
MFGNNLSFGFGASPINRSLPDSSQIAGNGNAFQRGSYLPTETLPTNSDVLQ